MTLRRQIQDVAIDTRLKRPQLRLSVCHLFALPSSLHNPASKLCSLGVDSIDVARRKCKWFMLAQDMVESCVKGSLASTRKVTWVYGWLELRCIDSGVRRTVEPSREE
jgi:hypothetical protein